MSAPSQATTATAPGWLTISRSTTSPSSWRKRSLRTLAMRPFQISSLPTRSYHTDLLRKHRTTRQGGPKEQPILVDTPPHRGGRQAGGTIAIEVDGGADSLVVAGQRL